VKKKYVIIFSAITIIILFIILMTSTRSKSFSLEEYCSEKNCTVEEVLNGIVEEEIFFGNINTAEDARKAAEYIWNKWYGPVIIFNKPYHVYYDELNQVWLVQGTYPILLIEGDPYIVIRKTDGKVLFYGKGKL